MIGLEVEVNPNRKGDGMGKPPSLTPPPKPPSLKAPKPRKRVSDVPIVGKVLCLMGKHDVDPGHFIDSHDNWDALSFCRRCRKLDV